MLGVWSVGPMFRVVISDMFDGVNVFLLGSLSYVFQQNHDIGTVSGIRSFIRVLLERK